ncbi:unnamed protein product [Xylocopa violacea]|uniref:Uncharacterized protein n=1 Tax=Xylocopa violacea TaxID=135666 RepID=A0ABP1N8T0_XYLVO
MEPSIKRTKVTKESCVHDIAVSTREIAEMIASISERYSTLLKVNKEVVRFMYNVNEDKKPSISDLQSDLEQTHLTYE